MRLAALGLAALLAAGCTVVVRPADPSRPRAQRPPDPPPVTVAPVLAAVAGTRVSYVSNWTEEVFVYEGRWYRSYRGTWYRAVRATGPWAAVSRVSVPRPILALPRDYRSRTQPAPVVVLPVQPAPAAPQPPPTVVHQQTTVVVQPPAAPVVVQPPAAPVVVQPPAAPVVVQPPAAPVVVRPPQAAAQPPAAPQPRQAVPVAVQEPPRRAPLPLGPAVEPTPRPVPQQAAHARVPPVAGTHAPPAHGARAHGGAPGRVTVSPTLAAVEGSPVAYVENWPEPLFHFGGLWYRSVDGAWFRASDLAGDWTAVTAGEVPQAVRDVPADFRRAKPGRGPAVPPAADPPGRAKGRKTS